ncbi:MAG TPA: DUF1552 domain-containing protein [Pirellulales bacterium]|nr:DUF1552 domain-containing protein [Pirellulales bacterium]
MPFKRLDRRIFLRSAGVAIALPFLDAMLPAGAAEIEAKKPIKRMVLIGRSYGLHSPYFFPEQTGKDYEPSRYLKLLQPLREHFTVFSGMSHFHANTHFPEVGLMTGVHPDYMQAGNIHNSISLDQEVASHFEGQTRFTSLVLGGGSPAGGGAAWNRRGGRIPPQQSAIAVFKQLFLRGTREEEAREMRDIRDGRSILDDVRDQISSISNRISHADRARLDLYLSSVRDAEKRMQQDEAWVKIPVPKVDVPPPTDDFGGVELLKRSRQWYDIIHLALQTDSTRVISVWLTSEAPPNIDGVNLVHHNASHHGQDPSKLAQLALIEEAELRLLSEFLEKMRNSSEGERTLLDNTAIFYGSNLGNASSHDATNLPVLLAGGGFKHQGHVAYDRKNNKPLSNLFVRMLHEMDIGAESFGASTGVVTDV